MGDFGRRLRRRRHLRGFDFLSGSGFTEDLKNVGIGLFGGVAGLLVNRFASSYLDHPDLLGAAGAPVRGAVGILGGTLLSRVNSPLGLGLGAAMGGQALLQAISNAASISPALAAYPWTRRYGVHGVGAYPWSRRYGMHAVGQMDPYSVRMPLQGLGRTRVIEQEPRAYEMNGLGAGYSYHSSAVRLHGLGQPKPTYYGWGLGQPYPGYAPLFLRRPRYGRYGLPMNG